MHQNGPLLPQGYPRPLAAVYPFRPESWPPLAEHLSAERLTWWPEIGVGYYPVTADPAKVYDQFYFDRFAQQADSDIGHALMQFRFELVSQYCRDGLVDVGIGSGAFVELRNLRGQPTYGYDVNAAGVKWLRDHGLFLNPYLIEVPAISLWDVLEHIADFPRLLENVTDYVFMSIPIFYGADHARASKHFRPTEHFWYFTRGGLERVMADIGFKLVTSSDQETAIGREDILSFVFRRI